MEQNAFNIWIKKTIYKQMEEALEAIGARPELINNIGPSSSSWYERLLTAGSGQGQLAPEDAYVLYTREEETDIIAAYL